MTKTVIKKITDRAAVLSIMGLGYVGLPLALLFVKAGFKVIGYDIDEDYLDSLRKGHSKIIDIADSELQKALYSGQFQLTSSVEALRQADVYLICVPTPLGKTRQPDLSYIERAMETLLAIWEAGKLVILESTTYPGTTDEFLLPLLEGNSMEIDRDFLLAFSPERVDPGNHAHPLATIPKVVGGVSVASTRAATSLYETVFEKVHAVSSARAAELTKLLENTFRNVNIALANEFSQICDSLGVNVWEVIAAASTKPFGFMPFYPGPGIGGHCIPLDPQYLVYKARLSGYEPRLVALADQINQEMPRYTVLKVMDMLNEQGKALKGARVLIVGVSYKPDVPDTRESPALSVIEELLARGAKVCYADPYVPILTLSSGESLTSTPLDEGAVMDSDLILILTAHGSVDYHLLARFAEKVLDTRNALPRALEKLALL